MHAPKIPYQIESPWRPVYIKDLQLYKRYDSEIMVVTGKCYTGRKFYWIYWDEEGYNRILKRYPPYQYALNVLACRVIEPSNSPLFWRTVQVAKRPSNKIVETLRNKYRVNGRRLY